MENVKSVKYERNFSLSTAQQQSGSGGAEEVDYWSLLSLFFGILGLLMKYRIFVWNALICCIISVTNMKTDNLDFKQVISSFSISLMGLTLGPQSKFFY